MSFSISINFVWPFVDFDDFDAEQMLACWTKMLCYGILSEEEPVKFISKDL